MLRGGLSWMRFAGCDLGQKTADENTIRLFRNKLTESGALKRVMKAFDWVGRSTALLKPLADVIGRHVHAG